LLLSLLFPGGAVRRDLFFEVDLAVIFPSPVGGDNDRGNRFRMGDTHGREVFLQTRFPPQPPVVADRHPEPKMIFDQFPFGFIPKFLPLLGGPELVEFGEAIFEILWYINGGFTR
jgi:hypothetical protein